MAQYVFMKLAEEAGVGHLFEVDSAATSREEIGNPVYPPARRMLASHGITRMDHRARQVLRLHNRHGCRESLECKAHDRR